MAPKKEVADIAPSFEDEYWRDIYKTRPYIRPDVKYEEYEPAYQYGWASRNRYGELNWDEIEEDMERNWHKNQGPSKLSWSDVKSAVRDAWHRVTSREDGKDGQ